MKRVVYLALLSAMAVLLLATIALAQSSPDQRGSYQSIQGQKGLNQSSPDQTQSPDQYSPNQSTPDQTQSPDASQQSSAPAQNAQTVHIRDHGFAFDPAQLNVPPKTIVTWVNDDMLAHTVTSDDGKLFDSGVLGPGQSYTVWFDGSGTVNYHCKIHPDMKGTLIVGESGSGGNTTTPRNTASDTTQPAGGPTQPTSSSTQPTGDTTDKINSAQQPAGNTQTPESTQTTGNPQTAEYNQAMHAP